MSKPSTKAHPPTKLCRALAALAAIGLADRSERRSGLFQRLRRVRLGPDQTVPKAAWRTLPVPDLGSRQGARRPQAVGPRRERRGLLLRSSIAVAARLQRKHQPAAATVPASRNRPIPAQPGPAQRHRPAAQRTTQKDLALPNPSGDLRRVCCGDQLSPPSKAVFDLVAGSRRKERRSLDGHRCPLPALSGPKRVCLRRKQCQPSPAR